MGVVFGLGRRPIRLKAAHFIGPSKNSIDVLYRPLFFSGASGPITFSAGSGFFDSRRFFVVSFAVFCQLASLAISALPFATLYAEAVRFNFGMILIPPYGQFSIS